MFYRFRSSAVICASLVLLYGNGLSADTIHVPVDQAAIDAASDGDEVVVDPGTYNETINFNEKAITLLSSSDNPADTIIDGDGAGSVVTCESGETSATVLQGFTLTGGYSDTGGGMFNDNNSSPTVTNCIFSGNETDEGGGSSC